MTIIPQSSFWTWAVQPGTLFVVPMGEVCPRTDAPSVGQRLLQVIAEQGGLSVEGGDVVLATDAGQELRLCWRAHPVC